ncbi:MFS transporter [Iamia sp. SCSIO 61187]|uniref:MFS transporter n=1 Tax=Iamia sp. SCSIO 61187 TaxID=2722752 RepID=UPI001C637FEB|nr:MFS transporter [Iamia sp. SCSIO 61187]QYG91911.1 MFS transporter [Iamia sp. SCSIO 61187]
MTATSLPRPAPPPPDETVVADPGRRRLVLAAVLTALTAVVASVAGLNVALGQLAADLGAGQGELLWVVNGYTIALAALLLPIGAVGDRWGRKPVLLGGLGLFLGASAASTLATTVDQLVALRVVAGVGAAMIMPVTLSVITSTFPEEERDRAVGMWAGFAGSGAILGLVASSIVVDNFTWPWVFATPMLLGGASLVLSLLFVPSSREHTEGRFDVGGSLLSALAVGALVLGIHEGPEAGWTEPITVTSLAVAAAAGAAFAWWELRQDHPLLQLRLFRNRTLAGGSVGLLGIFGLMGALFLVLIQLMQAVLGYSAVAAAVSLLPVAAVMMPLSSVAPLIARRVGLRAMIGGGALLIAVGMALMGTMASADGGYWSVAPGLFVMAAGMGLAMTSGTTAITGSLPVEDQGVASALNDTVRELGTAVGVALIGSVLSATYSSSVADATAGLPPEAAHAVEEGIGGAVAVTGPMGPEGQGILDAARGAFIDGWGTAMGLSAGLALAIAVFAFAWMPGRKQEGEDLVLEADDAELELAFVD